MLLALVIALLSLLLWTLLPQQNHPEVEDLILEEASSPETPAALQRLARWLQH